ncbi:MAG: hypothetical protein WD267_02400 [Balneolales bacterium]
MNKMIRVSNIIPFFLLLLVWASPLISHGQLIGSKLEIIDIERGDRTVVHQNSVRFEAPNWTPDGKELIFNQKGLLYRITVEGGEPEVIPTGFATSNNNDHGISADGKTLAISHLTPSKPSGTTSIIYTLPIEGGTPKQITKKGPSYRDRSNHRACKLHRRAGYHQRTKLGARQQAIRLCLL